MGTTQYMNKHTVGLQRVNVFWVINPNKRYGGNSYIMSIKNELVHFTHAALPHHHMLLIKELTNSSDVYINNAPHLCVHQVIQEMAWQIHVLASQHLEPWYIPWVLQMGAV